MLSAKPRFRETLVLLEHEGQPVLYDQLRVAWPPLVLSQAELAVLRHFDGHRTLAEIARAIPGEGAHVERALQAIYTRFDQHLYLESERLAAYLSGPVRQPSVFRDVEPVELTRTIDGLFAECGPPRGPTRSGLRAVLAPHMDYARGGGVYGHAFKALAEGTDAKLLVIVATSHYSHRRFSLSRMDYETPLGRVPTDQVFVDRIVEHYGEGLFDDPFAHLPEHSIELEVAIMQHIWRDRPYRIVPLLVGSFADCVARGREPRDVPEIARLAAALRAAEAAAGEEVAYVISGDLAHIGQKFNDPDLLAPAVLEASKAKDQQILERLERGCAAGYFAEIAGEQDCRRICGLPPTYVALEAIGGVHGRVLAYDQYVHPAGTESVSFASAAFFAQ